MTTKKFSPLVSIGLAGIPAEEICAIIKAAAESNCRSLNYGDLSIEFGPPKPQATAAGEQPLYLTESEARKAEATLMALNEQRIRREQLETLKITDPEAYEELMATGELLPIEDTDDAGQES